MPGDNPAQYKTKLENGERVLAKGKDGNCVYLGPKGCKIHGRAPQMCRLLDCRKYALIVRGLSPEERAKRLALPNNAATIAEGERRLVQSSFTR
jgi:Fe-S-cluster containining protein